MKNLIKRSLSFLLAITLVFGSAYVGLSEVDFGELFAVRAEAASSGKCGDNLTWNIDNAGTLRIIGTGKMYNYKFSVDEYGLLEKSDIPWYGNEKITKVVVKNGVTNICNGAFFNCTNLKSAIIGNSVTSIGDSAFHMCRNLESLTIPNSVTSIGEMAFGFCQSLTKMTIPNSVKIIGDYAFYGCRGLGSLKISNRIKSIGDSTFAACRSLTEITIPDSVTSIGDWAFSSCDGLTSIVIPNGVTSIGESAFQSCENLASIKIPSSVKSIGETAFWDCSNIESVYITDLAAWCKIDFHLGSTPLIYAEKLYVNNEYTTSLVLPEGITSIAAYAFEHYDGLTSVVIPNSVEKIGEDAFYDCSNLRCVFYAGTPKQWSEIVAGDSNEQFEYVRIHFDSTGHSFKTTTTKATLTSNGKVVTTCSVCGDVSKTTIYSPKTIALSSASVAYNGKVRTPSVVVKDSKGTTLVNGIDYKVSVPAGRKLPGVYKYTITFIGKYSGTKTLTFTILPKAPTTISATQSTSVITLKWSASAGATGYRVYQYSPSKGKYVMIASVKGKTSYKKDKNLIAGTEYRFKIMPYTKLSSGTVLWGVASDAFITATECKAPTIKSVTSPSKSKATVKWSNVGGETGYQLYYATSKNGTYKKINSYGVNVLTGSKTFSASASGKTIYFKARAYKKVNGQVIFSNWSSVKSVKLK